MIFLTSWHRWNHVDTLYYLDLYRSTQKPNMSTPYTKWIILSQHERHMCWLSFPWFKKLHHKKEFEGNDHLFFYYETFLYISHSFISNIVHLLQLTISIMMMKSSINPSFLGLLIKNEIVIWLWGHNERYLQKLTKVYK